MFTLTRPETKRIIGHFSPEVEARILNYILVDQLQQAVERGDIPREKWREIGGSALGFYITNAEAISMLTDYQVGIDAGTAAHFTIYDSTVPADADTALGAQVTLAELVCNATVFSGIADIAPGARATFNSITSDSSANASGTATFFRLRTQSGGTTVAQGTVGTATSDLILNTVAITSGSTVSITSATITLPEGP